MGGSRPRPLGKSWFAAGLFVAGASGCSEAPQSFATSTSSQPVLMQGDIRGDNLPDKTVVLTWDDGPDEHTLELAQYLKDEGVKATFFINGSRICKTWQGDVCTEPIAKGPCNDGQMQAPVENPIYYPETLLDEIIALGHRIGNHTTTHCHLDNQDNPADFAFELTTTQEVVDRHICDGIFFFRAPFGAWDDQAAGIAQGIPALDKLIGPVNWDVDGGDWDCYQTGKSIQECGDGYLGILNEQPGQKGVFLLHDRPEFNVGIDGPLLLAQYLIPKLKEQGYTFSTLDDMLDLTPTGPMACQPPPMGGSGGMGGMAGGGMGGVGGIAGTGGVGGLAGSGGMAGVMMPATMAGTGGMAPVVLPPTASGQESSCAVQKSPSSSSGSLFLWLAGLLLLSRRRR